MKVLNCYAGLGGNRELWKDVNVTAIENNPEIATIYRDLFPHDTVIEADAHQYLLDNYKDFDFIWCSPPCPSHSRLRKLGVNFGRTFAIYPDMGLYQEILLLTHYFNGLWVVENVVPFYDYLIKPSVVLGRHPFWSNFLIAKRDFLPTVSVKGAVGITLKDRQKSAGIDLSGYKMPGHHGKIKALKNRVDPMIGDYVLSQARQSPTPETASMQLTLM